ncbi:hypothetical protein B0H16DRAFT_1485956 [Mycena metata]|uniref:Uncharacterized protein n=1 Tax=Mycena metata TaxID=1033252 RepID=A0AAD7DKW7_9AGAR|nr:hypothetical protein B0H16DRAFT_1485956 [Mycena metata]
MPLRSTQRALVFDCFAGDFFDGMTTIPAAQHERATWELRGKRHSEPPHIAGWIAGIELVRVDAESQFPGAMKAFTYFVDDGSAVLECFYEFPSGDPPSARQQRATDHRLDALQVGDSVSVVGVLDEQLGYPRLRLESILECSSNDEPLHWIAARARMERDALQRPRSTSPTTETHPPTKKSRLDSPTSDEEFGFVDTLTDAQLAALAQYDAAAA